MKGAELMGLLRAVQGAIDALRRDATPDGEPSANLRRSLEALGTTSAQLRSIQAAVFDLSTSLEAQTVLLDRERRRASEIFHSVPAACVMTDHAGRVLDANPALHTLLGRTAGTIVGQAWSLFVDEADRALWRSLLETLRTDSQVHGVLHVRVAGRPVLLRVTGTGLPHHAVLEVLWVLETADGASIASGDGQDGHGTNEDFLAMLGHELRSPLAPIRAAVDLWQLQGPKLCDEDRRATLDILARQTDHLTRLVDDILDAARIKHGKLRVRADIVELNDVVTQSCEDVRPTARRHHLEVEVPPTPVRVSGDAVRLRQVVVNLLHNAIKFTPPDGRIRIALSAVEKRAVIEVSDDGVGIARDQLDAVFGTFVQAEESLVRSPDGLGLGLSVVRDLVELHGGTVTVRSEGPGRGSAFRVELPRVRGRTTSEVARRDALAGMQPLRLLVVDDDADTTHMLARLLETHGHVVTRALDGEGALDAFARVPTDAVLLDLGLPDIDGTQVARRIREMDPGIHVIAVTGHAGERAEERIRGAAFSCHLLKPVEPEALRRALDQVRPRRSD